MREIRFRGKRLDSGEWVYGCLKHVYRKDFPPEITSWTDAEGGYYRTDPVNPNTVGQYTGLRDSEGKEIYEGDLCWDGNCIWRVEYYNGCFFLLGMDLLLMQNEKVRVVGNIHDNPELLEDGGQE